MQSFLSKVFGRKKDDKDVSPTQLSPGELLGERFEAISPNVSPSAAKFLELDPKVNTVGESSKDPGFSLFRAKSRPSSPETKSKRHDTLPQLSLAFLEPNGPLSPAADFVREADPDMSVLLSDAIIGQRKLNPLEALVLIRACSQAIIARGLETLGVMHPHWYSASPDVQRRLISQFINSLNADATISPTSNSPTTAFESEITFTRPHDAAAVLRWGLRHLQLDSDQLGKDETWYTKFLEAEAAADYPLKAFSEQLAPHLPPAHLEVLTATLEIFSSLAAHAEANSTSGSKLSKIFGLWLLVSQRVDSKDDFHAFYQRWERMGRILEHLFLARIRDDSADRRMPVRLLELVRQYPYTKGLSNPMTDVKLLARPRITTMPYDALFVRIEVELPSEKRRPKHKINPLTLLADAFSLQIEGEHAELWSVITSESKNGSSPSPLSNVFADETIRFLSMVPGMDAAEVSVKSPSLSIFAGGMLSPHRRSATAIEKGKGKPAPTIVSGHVKPATDPTPMSTLSPLDLTQNWDQFSTSGFFEVSPAIVPLASTLFDNDVEKTIPPDPPASVSLSRSISRRSSKSKRSRQAKSPSSTSPRKSEETIRPTAIEASSALPAPSLPQQDNICLTRATKVQIIQIDEAFVDFWSDALLDPISSDWPTFIICKFKSTILPKLVIGVPEEGQTAKVLKWLILEHIYTVKPPSPPAPVEVPRPRASSPSSESMSPKKRFSFWSMNRSLSGTSVGSPKGKNKPKSPVVVGEMGELLEEGSASSSSSKSPISRIRKSLDISRKPSEIHTLKKAESMAVIKESAPAVILSEAHENDNQPPQTQPPLEESQPADTLRVEGSALTHEKQTTTVSSSGQAIEGPLKEGAFAVNIYESSPEVSHEGRAAEKNEDVVDDEIPAVVEEIIQSQIQRQEDKAVYSEIASNGGDIIEPSAGSADVGNLPDLHRESSAGSPVKESLQVDATLSSESPQDLLPSSEGNQGLSDVSTPAEEQVEVVQDDEQPALVPETVEEAVLSEPVQTATPNKVEHVPAHDDQLDVTPTADPIVELVVEDEGNENTSYADIAVDVSVKADLVDNAFESSADNDNYAIPPVENVEAGADVKPTEPPPVVLLHERTTETQNGDHADAEAANAVTVDADAVGETKCVDTEVVVTQKSSAEPASQDPLQSDAVQQSEQDSPLAEEHQGADVLNNGEEIQVENTPVSDTEPINNEELSSDTRVTEVTLDAQETNVDVPFAEILPSKEGKEVVEPAITATVGEAKYSIDEESSPVPNEQPEIVPGPEHDKFEESPQAIPAETTPAVVLEESSLPQIQEVQEDTAADIETTSDPANPVINRAENEGTPELHHAGIEGVVAQEATQGLHQVDVVQSSETSEDPIPIEQQNEASVVSDSASPIEDTELDVATNVNEPDDSEQRTNSVSAIEDVQIAETLLIEEDEDDTEAPAISENLDEAKASFESECAPIHGGQTNIVPGSEHLIIVDSIQDADPGPSLTLLPEGTSEPQIQAQDDTAADDEVPSDRADPAATTSTGIQRVMEEYQESPAELATQGTYQTKALYDHEHIPPSDGNDDQAEVFQEEEPASPATFNQAPSDALTEQTSVPPSEDHTPQVHNDQVAVIYESTPNDDQDLDDQLKEDMPEVINNLTADPIEDSLVPPPEVEDGNPAGTSAVATVDGPNQSDVEAQEDSVDAEEIPTNMTVMVDGLPTDSAELKACTELPSVEAATEVQTDAPTSEQPEGSDNSTQSNTHSHGNTAADDQTHPHQGDTVGPHPADSPLVESVPEPPQEPLSGVVAQQSLQRGATPLSEFLEQEETTDVKTVEAARSEAVSLVVDDVNLLVKETHEGSKDLPDYLVERSAVSQTAEHPTVISIPVPQQVVEGAAVVDGDVIADLIENTPLEVADESSSAEKDEMKPTEKIVHVAFDETPASQIQEQEESAVNGVDGDEGESTGTNRMNSAESEVVVVFESAAEPVISEAAQVENLQDTETHAHEELEPHIPTDDDKPFGIERPSSAAKVWEDGVETDETSPTERKQDIESPVIPDNVDEATSLIEDKSEPSTPPRSEDEHDMNSTQDALTDPPAVVLDQTPQVQIHAQGNSSPDIVATSVEPAAIAHQESQVQEASQTDAVPMSDIPEQDDTSEVRDNQAEIVEDGQPPIPVILDQDQFDILVEQVAEASFVEEQSGQALSDEPTLQTDVASLLDSPEQLVTPVEQHGGDLSQASTHADKAPIVADDDAAASEDAKSDQTLDEVKSSIEAVPAPPLNQAQDTVFDNETSSNLNDPAVPDSVEIETRTEPHDDVTDAIVQESSAESAIPDVPQVDTSQLFEGSEYELLPVKQQEQSVGHSTEVDQVDEELELHLPTNEDKPVDIEGPSSAAKEPEEDIQSNETPPTEERKEDTEFPVILDDVDKAKSLIEDKSEPSTPPRSEDEHDMNSTQDALTGPPAVVLDQTPQVQIHAQVDSSPDIVATSVEPAAIAHQESQAQEASQTDAVPVLEIPEQDEIVEDGQPPIPVILDQDQFDILVEQVAEVPSFVEEQSGQALSDEPTLQTDVALLLDPPEQLVALDEQHDGDLSQTSTHADKVPIVADDDAAASEDAKPDHDAPKPMAEA